MITTRIASAAALATFGLAALGGIALAAPGNAETGASGRSSGSSSSSGKGSASSNPVEKISAVSTAAQPAAGVNPQDPLEALIRQLDPRNMLDAQVNEKKAALAAYNNEIRALNQKLASGNLSKPEKQVIKDEIDILYGRAQFVQLELQSLLYERQKINGGNAPTNFLPQPLR